MTCCSSHDYGVFFDEKLARKDADRYRKKGVGGASRRLVELVADRGLQGATVLEIGGGVGTLQLELLDRGAEHATNVELSPSYERAASELVEERGAAARVERRIGDLVQDPELAAAADVVLLHRVVCCYPDYQGLLAVAAAKARRLVAFSFPPDNAAARAAIGLLNLWPRLRRCAFRSFVHPEREMLATLEREGFRVAARKRSGVWRIAVLERP